MILYWLLLLCCLLTCSRAGVCTDIVFTYCLNVRQLIVRQCCISRLYSLPTEAQLAIRSASLWPLARNNNPNLNRQLSALRAGKCPQLLSTSLWEEINLLQEGIELHLSSMQQHCLAGSGDTAQPPKDRSVSLLRLVRTRPGHGPPLGPLGPGPQHNFTLLRQ